MTMGDASPFPDRLAKMLPNDRDRLILTSYLAAIIQHKGFKFQWAPLIQGTEGNGKGVILKSMEYAVGKDYTHKPSAKELGASGSKFTCWIANKLLIIVDEIDRNRVV